MRWPPVIFASLLTMRGPVSGEGYYFRVKPILLSNLTDCNETVGRNFASRDTWYDREGTIALDIG